MSTKSDAVSSKPRTFIEEARRSQIVTAAAEVVAELGYARTSIAKIADRVGVSKGVVTYYFGTKDELLRLVVTRFFDRGWAHMEPRVLAAPSPTQQIKEWIAAEWEFFEQHRTEFLAMSEIVTNHRSLDGSLAYAHEFDEELSAMIELLEAGQQLGEIRALNAPSVAGIILKSASSILETWAFDPTIDLDAELVVLLDFIDHAIAKEPL
ncbi:MAG: TetR/AcrR family transcriptional regulator [Gulosibacter sp.]|uniref:TetR/AcrR family transcriptional regulator n=1 Tax=Gulosibacter sp. TaxID=2817531 RepID=UPI003F93DF5C